MTSTSTCTSSPGPPCPAAPACTSTRTSRPGDPRLSELYRRADVFALPTRGDASPWVLLEAMEAGLPVVTSAVGAISEVVRPEQTGLLVPPQDVSRLRDALCRLAMDRDTRLRLGSAGRSLVEQRHDVLANIGSVFELAEQIAE